MPEQRTLYDFLSSFLGGVNSDLPPVSLPKDVAAWTTNSTLRGGFPRPRPPRFQRALTFSSAEIQTVFDQGFFQGAGYYRPDQGAAQLVVAISGRLFTITESAAIYNVVEITIPGDPNDASTGQTWMNQAERWLIITDGTSKLPIFWDGVTARRSYGPSVELGQVTATSVPAPDDTPIGETLVLTLAEAYTGPFNVPLFFNGEFYQALSTSSGSGTTPTYPLTIKNVSGPGTDGVTIPSGSAVQILPYLIGVVLNDVTVIDEGGAQALYFTLAFGSVSGISFVPRTRAVNVILDLANSPDPSLPFAFSAESIDYTNNTIYVRSLNTFTAFGSATVRAGTLVYFYPPNAPNSTVGTTQAPFSTPPYNTALQISLTAPYTGPIGQVVWIAGYKFIIEDSPPPVPGNQLTVINMTDTSSVNYVFSGPNSLLLSVPELPAGRIGAYGLGHQAMSLVDGLSYIYGDAVGGPSGTPANNYRDAVLKTTENDFMVGGGSFRIPSSGGIITSMTFTAILDAAYGQGPLEIGTQYSIFTCAVPTDRDTWVHLENPILTQALIGDGPLAQNSTILANSDTLFRHSEGLGSLIFARRNFETWGNTPISTEMNRIVESDDRSLLAQSSAVTFDNRFLHTASPEVTNNGVAGATLLALNFDPVSSLRGKAPSIWESVWDGIKVLQVITGIFGGVERCYMFVQDEDEGIQLWEQLRTDSPEYYDNGTDRITWTLETPCIFKPEDRDPRIPIVRLTNGKIHVDSIKGEVSIRVQFRPDFHRSGADEGWTDWITLNISDTTDPGYLSPLGLGTPPADSCDGPNNRPLRSGRFMQIKYTVTGQCRITGQEYSAVEEPNVMFPSPLCSTISS